METKTVLERYARYYNFLQQLGGFPFSENPIIDDLELSKGVIQSGYKEMKEINFEGNLIDYLCYVSTCYIVNEVKKILTKDIDFNTACHYIVEKAFKHDPADTNNLLRLAVKNPGYLYNLIGSTAKDSATIHSKKAGFLEIYELWLKKYLTKKS